MKRSETTEQINLFQWAERMQSIIPALALMYHVPNEGKRTNGGILKAAGLKSGVPDVCLPVPSGEFHALYIELKYGKNKTTIEQEEYMALLRQQGNETAVCYSALEAKEKILEYLDQNRPEKLSLSECITAPWIAGKCDGMQVPGKMFSLPECQKCEYHTPTKAEETIKKNLAAVPDCVKNDLLEVVADLSAGKARPNCTMEETLEKINKLLAAWVRGQHLTVKQSAAVLSVAMNAYYAGKGGNENE